MASDAAKDEQPTELMAVETKAELPASSVVESLRQRREKKAEDHRWDFEVPGYDGCLVIRMGPLGGRFIAKLRERAERSTAPDRDFHANADVLIAACKEVLGREAPGAELQPLDPENGAVRVDERLAELLQIPPTTARDLLRTLFDRTNDPELAVGVAAGQYVEWASSANSELDEAFLGE